MNIQRPVKFLAIAALAVVGMALFGYVVMLLWNALMPAVFGLKMVSYWQAVGLLILAKIFFGGFHGRPSRGMHRRRGTLERWEQMTPEERERFQQGMRQRCGGPMVPQAKAEA